MNRNHVIASAITLACVFASAALPAFAGAMDYRFELVGKPQHVDQRDFIQVRLVHAMEGMDSMPMSDAVVFESKADMGPPGMETMTAPVKMLPAKDGIYTFEIEPGMPGTWALHLAAKVQGEPETVRGTVKADLVK